MRCAVRCGVRWVLIGWLSGLHACTPQDLLCLRLVLPITQWMQPHTLDHYVCLIPLLLLLLLLNTFCSPHRA